MAKRHMKMCSTSVIIKELQIKTIVRYHFTIVRMVIIKKIKNNKCSGNSAQCYAAAWMEGEIEREEIHVCLAESRWPPETTATLLIGYTPIYNKKYFKKIGTSQVVQQLRLHSPNAGDPSSITGWGTRCHRPQLRSCMLQLRPSAAKLVNK